MRCIQKSAYICEYLAYIDIPLIYLCLLCKLWALSQEIVICFHVSVTVEMGTMENNEDTGVQHAMIKPVFIKNSEIQLDRSNNISDFEMYESLNLNVA